MLSILKNIFVKKEKNTGGAKAVGSSRAKYSHYSNELSDTLRGPAGVAIYDKMRRQDATIKSIISVITSPIKGAVWNIRAQSENPKVQDIAEVFYSYFWEQAGAVFSEFLNNALTMVPFGFAVFEKVWTTKYIDGKLYQFIDLQFRPQITITEINPEERFVKQSVRGVDYKIPFENLVFLTLDKEGEDYWGNSVLRACYRSYLFKMEQFDNWKVAGGRVASGFLRVSYPKDIKQGSKEYEELDRATKLIATNQLQALMAAEHITAEFVTPAIDANFYKTTIDSLDTDMRNAALANFIGLGTTNTGSYSVGEVQYKLFMQAERAISSVIEQVFTAQVLRPMTEANFGPQDVYPELVCQDLDKESVARNMSIALQYFTSGVLEKTEQDDADIRYKLGLSESTEVKKSELIKKEEEPEEKEELKAAKKRAAGWGKEAEVYTEELQRAMQGNLSVMADKAIADTRRYLTKYGIGGLADDITISTALYQKIITKKLAFLAVRGWDSGRAYAEANGGPKAAKKKEFELDDEDYNNIPTPLKGYVTNKAKNIVAEQAQQLKRIILNVANTPDYGFSVDNIIAKIGKQVDAYLASNKVSAAANMTVLQTLGDSEQSYYKNECRDGIAYFVYVLGNAKEHTAYCLSLEGRTFTPYGQEFYLIVPTKHFGCTARLVPVFYYEGMPAPDPKRHDNLDGVDLSFRQF